MGGVTGTSFITTPTSTWTTSSLASTTLLSSSVNTIATNTTLRQMRTAFAQPPSCTGQFSTTSYLYFNSTNSVTTYVTLAISDTLSSQFTTCQPPGWDTVVPENRFVFSPGVCPQSWTAYDLSATTTQYLTTISSAYCCSSGFTLSFDYPYQTQSTSAYQTHNNDGGPYYTVYPGPVSGYHGPGCYRQVPVASQTTAPEATPSALLEMHLPYSVQWQASDTKHMSPQPPPVPCTYSVESWIPGQLLQIGDATYRQGDGAGVWTSVVGTSGTFKFGTYVPTMSNAPINTDCPLVEGVGKGVNHSYASLLYFGMIGAPIIAVALISLCSILCFRHSRKKKRERLRAAMLAQERRENNVDNARAQQQYEQSVGISLAEIPHTTIAEPPPPYVAAKA